MARLKPHKLTYIVISGKERSNTQISPTVLLVVVANSKPEGPEVFISTYDVSKHTANFFLTSLDFGQNAWEAGPRCHP